MSGVPRRAGAAPPPAVDRTWIGISRPVHKRLSEIKDEQQRRLSRQVSFTEVIEGLLDRAGAA